MLLECLGSTSSGKRQFEKKFCSFGNIIFPKFIIFFNSFVFYSFFLSNTLSFQMFGMSHATVLGFGNSRYLWWVFIPIISLSLFIFHRVIFLWRIPSSVVIFAADMGHLISTNVSLPISPSGVAPKKWFLVSINKPHSLNLHPKLFPIVTLPPVHVPAHIPLLYNRCLVSTTYFLQHLHPVSARKQIMRLKFEAVIKMPSIF